MVRGFLFLGMVLWMVIVLCNPAFAETTAFIANTGADEMVRITTGDEITTTTGMDGKPYGVAVTPDGLQVLVTIEDENQLAFITTADFFGTPFFLPVGESPRGVTVDPNGKYAYVANFDDDTVTKIHISTKTVTNTYDVNDGPLGVVARYDEISNTSIVYVANHLDDNVIVIDNEDKTTISDVGDGPAGMSISPDGAYVYVANMNDDTVSVIDTKNDKTVDTVRVGSEPWGVAVGAKGKYVYVTNSGDDTVTVIRTGNNSIDRIFNVGDEPMGVAAPRNGNFAYVVNQNGGSISKVDMDDDSVTEIADGVFTDAFSMGAFIGDELPNRPTSIELTVKNESKIDLSWIDNSDDEMGFKIERSKEDEENYVQISDVDQNTTTFQDHGLVSKTVYFYRIRSYNEGADSEYSSSANGETMPYSGSIWCFINSVFKYE